MSRFSISLLLIHLALPCFAQEPAEPPPGSNPPRKLPESVLNAPDLPLHTTQEDRFIQTIRWNAVADPQQRSAAQVQQAQNLETLPAPLPDLPKSPGDPTPAAPDPATNPTNAPPSVNLIAFPLDESSFIQIEGVMRGYFRDDQRILWSGLEQTFGAEGILRPLLMSVQGKWAISAEGEFYLNEPYGSSILSDPTRNLYKANFDVQTFQIFQLYAQLQRGDFLIRLGRSRTPFGQYDSPTFSNAMIDAPFLRTEVIGFVNTGLFFRYQPQGWSVDVAVVNDQADLATNSSKGLVSRLGIDRPNWTLGASAMVRDGVSSDQQKQFNNVFGFDGSARFGQFTAYGEATYDQHGFVHNFALLGDPAGLGVRDLYGRDVFKGDNQRIGGLGFYTGVRFRNDRLMIDGCYCFYYPEQIGISFHDAQIHQGVLKAAYSITPHFQIFSFGIVENYRPKENGVIQRYHPYAFENGLQLVF
ncbi:MAG TPA: hypothetical protein VGZ47_06475 [Gemmataceae bacterium]|nr:hypothetical protein [Gemmataceae bacterium]